MWGQGFGGPLGFGMLDDISGDNHYYRRRRVSRFLSRNARL